MIQSLVAPICCNSQLEIYFPLNGQSLSTHIKLFSSSLLITAYLILFVSLELVQILVTSTQIGAIHSEIAVPSMSMSAPSGSQWLDTNFRIENFNVCFSQWPKLHIVQRKFLLELIKSPIVGGLVPFGTTYTINELP